MGAEFLAALRDQNVSQRYMPYLEERCGQWGCGCDHVTYLYFMVCRDCCQDRLHSGRV